MEKWNRPRKGFRAETRKHTSSTRVAYINDAAQKAETHSQKRPFKGTLTITSTVVESDGTMIKHSKIPKAPHTVKSVKLTWSESKIPTITQRREEVVKTVGKRTESVQERNKRKTVRKSRSCCINQSDSARNPCKLKQQPRNKINSRQPVKEGKLNCKEGKAKKACVTQKTNTVSDTNCTRAPTISQKRCEIVVKPNPKQTSAQQNSRDKKKRAAEPKVQPEKTELLELCTSMRHDINTHEDTDRKVKRNRSDFIDQCLAFHKECDEATGRADRLLEELSFIRPRRRSLTQSRKAFTSWTSSSAPSNCHSLLEESVKGVAKNVRKGNGNSRENLLDSPMDTMRGNTFDSREKWQQKYRPDDGAEESVNVCDSAFVRRSASCSGKWIQEITQNSSKEIGPSLHVELINFLERMAKLELENRALKELLIIKCGLPNDAGVEDLLNKALRKKKKLPRSSGKALIGNVSVDSAFEGVVS